MKRLHSHLDLARREYQSLHYPGDLAAEMLAPARKTPRWMWGAGLAAAAAIALILSITLRTIDINNPGPPIGTGGPIGAPMFQNISLSLSDLPGLTLPDMPQDANFSPEVPDMHSPSPDLSIGTPSFSLMHDDETQQPPSVEVLL